MKQLLKNLGYQTIYEILALCLPLISSPYVSRVLQADGLGIFSYTHSIAQYFALLALTGVATYGSRTIAMSRTDRKEMSQNFWSIYAMQLITSLSALSLYLIYCFFIVNENQIMAIVQACWIIANVIDVAWLFFGLEEFRITVTRNIIVKIISVILIFVLVRDKGDLWIYALIMAGSMVVSQSLLWPFVLKKVDFYRPKWSDIRKHIKPNLALFVPILGTTVFHVMDKTMLGIADTELESGYYYNADKVMSMPLSLINATGTVMLPKMSTLVAKGETKSENRLLSLSVEAFMFLAIAMSFGISAVAPEFIPIFYGAGYDPCVPLVYLFSGVMVFKALSGMIKNQYLIPHKKEKAYIVSVLVAAGVNLVANTLLMFVWHLGSRGATIGTLIAEGVCCIMYICSVDKSVGIVRNILRALLYVIPGAVMLVVVRLTARLPIRLIFRLLLEIGVGVIVFLAVSVVCWLVYKKDPLYKVLRSFMQSILKKGKKKETFADESHPEAQN